MMLAGVDHITISPKLLRELIDTVVDGYGVGSIFDAGEKEGENGEKVVGYGESESEWRMAFTRSGKGEGERKLSQVSERGCFLLFGEMIWVNWLFGLMFWW